MIQRKCRSSFSKDDEERLLAFMEVTRYLSIRYGAAHGFHSQQHALHTSLNTAIDKLAEQLTGDPRLYSSHHHTAGGRVQEITPKQERELRWQELRFKYR